VDGRVAGFRKNFLDAGLNLADDRFHLLLLTIDDFG
jgi:hypothetical protein